MASDLLRRVRWRNVARAGGAVLAVAAVVAWPRLTPPAPRLPDPAPRPLVGGASRAPLPPAVEKPGPRRTHRPRAPRAPRPRPRPRPTVAPPVVVVPPAPTPPPPAPPPPAPRPAPTVEPAQEEFGFEAG